MKKKEKLLYCLLAILIFGGIVGIVIYTSRNVEPEPQVSSAPNNGMATPGQFQFINFFAQGGTTTPLDNRIATTTSATSSEATIHDIQGAKKATVFFSRTGIYGNAGASVFSIQVSDTASTTDDTNWITYNKLIDNVINTNAQQLTRVGTSSISAATTTKMYSLDLTADAVRYIRCIVIETTDGEHGCTMLVQY